ncbi:MAG TPA: Bcr/CflA family drug resistance efflux transporter, partial [Shewanella frigidimarina]|nr:Bcr/CflA family drug resistance efflux transporter [Shewanella frigidimarina]
MVSPSKSDSSPVSAGIPHLAMLIPMLAAIVAITPLAIDMYLPAMSILALGFDT